MIFKNAAVESKINIVETKINILITRAKLPKTDSRRLMLDDASNVGTIQDQNGILMMYSDIEKTFARSGLNIDDFKTIKNQAHVQDYQAKQQYSAMAEEERRRREIANARAQGVNLLRKPHLRTGGA